MAKKSNGGFLVSVIILLAVAFGAYYAYQQFFAKVNLKDKNYTYIYIEHDDSFEDVISDINAEGIIENLESFEWLAKQMKLEDNIHAGKYRINKGMNMRQIINLIKYNKQEKVKLTLNSQIHTFEEFIIYAADKLSLEEGEIEDYFLDEKRLLSEFNLDPDNAFAMVVPGVYEVSWAINAEELFETLQQKFNKVWNQTRRNQCKQMKLSVAEVITLASIAQSESNIRSEQEKIAGVYLNRLNKNMLLQADPTLKFANKNYDAQRVLDQDKAIDSPYNTYKYKGLPPGPICLVSISAIDATLNYKKHNYLFFCAKPQLNGYSDYSVTYDQHCKYANAYQKNLNKRGINR